jgi:hypothetical protein
MALKRALEAVLEGFNQLAAQQAEVLTISRQLLKQREPKNVSDQQKFSVEELLWAPRQPTTLHFFEE